MSDQDYEPIEDDKNIEEELRLVPNETFMNWYSDFEDQIANNVIEEDLEENVKNANDPINDDPTPSVNHKPREEIDHRISPFNQWKSLFG